MPRGQVRSILSRSLRLPRTSRAATCSSRYAASSVRSWTTPARRAAGWLSTVRLIAWTHLHQPTPAITFNVPTVWRITAIGGVLLGNPTVNCTQSTRHDGCCSDGGTRRARRPSWRVILMSMRSQKRRRPRLRRPAPPPAGVVLADVAERVSYTGSPEHKTAPTLGVPPKLRADATKCDPRLGDPATLTSWLRQAVAAGHTSEMWEGDFPRYVWYQRDGVWYEGRLVNQGLDEYKGYALQSDEAGELGL